ncbi:MAG: glycosyl transferase [Patescibacteria group bacterium]|nr:MAG: glycosyl transferase [Patescibacteria group bacterium]
MKVALVHDYIKEYGGAERVLESLHTIFPEATVFTSVYLPEYLGPHKNRFKNWKIKTSYAQYLPGKAKLISFLRIISPFLFRSFDFQGYDIIIVSATGAYFPNALQKKGAKLICYCHTPPRYLYGYATAREWKKYRILRILGELVNHFLRIIDYATSRNVDYYIANSDEVRKRIQKFYRREAQVIYPPLVIRSTSKKVNLKQDTNAKYKSNTGYFITGGRLARAKHVDLIIKACNELGVRLKVFGKAFAGYKDDLLAIASPTIEFVGEVSDEEKYNLLKGAKAFLFASEDEDFGITPVEAMSVGVPVIAYRSGGVRETVRENKTGIFFDQLTTEALKEKIKQFDSIGIKAEDCIKRANEFSEERFKKEISSFISSLSK